jgi:hypothetical protein
MENPLLRLHALTHVHTLARLSVATMLWGDGAVLRQVAVLARGWHARAGSGALDWGCIAPLPFPAASSLRYARKSKCSRTAPLQVLFSLLNLAAHVHGLRRTWALAPTPPSPRAGGPVPSGSRGWCASYAVNPAGQSPCLELPAPRRHKHRVCMQVPSAGARLCERLVVGGRLPHA